jgi:hypothetical protein
LRAGNRTPSRYLPTWAGNRFLKKSTVLYLLASDVVRHGTAPRRPGFRFGRRFTNFACVLCEVRQEMIEI